MNPEQLNDQEGYEFEVISEVMVCNYSEGMCSLQNDIPQEKGTILTYVGVSADPNGFVFENNEGAQFCLHVDDLLHIAPK